MSPFRAYLYKSVLQRIHFRGSYVCHIYCNYKKYNIFYVLGISFLLLFISELLC